MSSLVRRLQIRAMKRVGYRRTKFDVVKDVAGNDIPVRVPRGGLILNPRDEVIGKRWPRSMPAWARSADLTSRLLGADPTFAIA